MWIIWSRNNVFSIVDRKYVYIISRQKDQLANAVLQVWRAGDEKGEVRKSLVIITRFPFFQNNNKNRYICTAHIILISGLTPSFLNELSISIKGPWGQLWKTWNAIEWMFNADKF